MEIDEIREHAYHGRMDSMKGEALFTIVEHMESIVASLVVIQDQNTQIIEALQSHESSEPSRKGRRKMLD